MESLYDCIKERSLSRTRLRRTDSGTTDVEVDGRRPAGREPPTRGRLLPPAVFAGLEGLPIADSINPAGPKFSRCA